MSKLVAIDNGHGMKTAGKRTPKMPNGRVVHEWEFNHPTAKKLEVALKRCGFRTLMVSDTSADTRLQDRTARANNAKADALVSIHYNALTGVWGSQNGVETLYFPSSSGSKKLAGLMQNELVKATGLRSRGTVPRGNLWMLKQSHMVAALAECGFMDNRAEAKLMLDSSYQSKCAEAMARSLCTYFGVRYISPNEGIVAPSTPSRKPSVSGNAMAVDGYWGAITTAALQRALGTTVDGVISGQYSNGVTKNIGGVSYKGTRGSNVVRALQKKVGVRSDGYMGPATVRALQKYLRTPVDGVISKPSVMVRELQRRLSKGAF